MSIQSGHEKRAALEYARSQGWKAPEECETYDGVSWQERARLAEKRLLELDEMSKTGEVAEYELAEQRLEETRIALTAERESHAVTKAALLRGKKASRAHELEAALRRLVSDDVTEADLDAAKALLR